MHPPAQFIPRAQLMQVGGITPRSSGGPLCAITAFYWWIERINDRLPRLGWRIR